MKKYETLLLFLVLLMPAIAVAQQREVRDVDTFDEISFAAPGKLVLRQGDAQRVELVGKADILKEVETEVRDGRLRIKRESRWFEWPSKSDIVVYITVRELEGLSVSGSGNAIAESVFRTDDIDLRVSGSGSIEIEVEARGDVEAHVSGSGNLQVTGRCDDLETRVSGSGKVTLNLNVAGHCAFAVSGSGKIEARGQAEEVQVRISGSGKVRAAELEADRCDVNISGSGDVEVYAREELEAHIGGSGSVSYRGEPKRVDSHASGSGSVRRM